MIAHYTLKKFAVVFLEHQVVLSHFEESINFYYDAHGNMELINQEAFYRN